MTVYVSALRPSSPGRTVRYARMTGDTLTELDAAAAALGMRIFDRFPATATRSAYYSITADQRLQAITSGALTNRPTPRCGFGLLAAFTEGLELSAPQTLAVPESHNSGTAELDYTKETPR